MKKVLSALCALAMITAMCGCSSKEKEDNKDSDTVSTTEAATINPELSKVIEYNGYSFNVSPYWNEKKDGETSWYYATSDNFFIVSTLELIENVDNTEQYYDYVKEFDGKEDSEIVGSKTRTSDLITNSNGVDLCKIFTKWEDKELGINLSYTLILDDGKALSFTFSDMGDSESYIPDIIESIKKIEK